VREKRDHSRTRPQRCFGDVTGIFYSTVGNQRNPVWTQGVKTPPDKTRLIQNRSRHRVEMHCKLRAVHRQPGAAYSLDKRSLHPDATLDSGRARSQAMYRLRQGLHPKRIAITFGIAATTKHLVMTTCTHGANQMGMRPRKHQVPRMSRQ